MSYWAIKFRINFFLTSKFVHLSIDLFFKSFELFRCVSIQTWTAFDVEIFLGGTVVKKLFCLKRDQVLLWVQSYFAWLAWNHFSRWLFEARVAGESRALFRFYFWLRRLLLDKLVKLADFSRPINLSLFREDLLSFTYELFTIADKNIHYSFHFLVCLYKID